MSASDARAIPLKGFAYRVTFPILDADGDLVTGAASLDSEVSKDAGTYADCTNEATEIATSSGTYYLDLTASEMDADTVAIIVKTATSGAKTTVLVINTRRALDGSLDSIIDLGTAQSAGTDKLRMRTGASAVNDYYNGCELHIIAGTGAGQSRLIVDYDGTTKDAYVYVAGGSTVGSQWATTPDNTSVYVVKPHGYLPASLAITAGYVQSDLTTAALAAITTELTSNFIPNLVQARYGAAFTLPFGMVDATDLHTPETGVTVTVEISKDGAAFAAATNSATEIAVGEYSIALTAAEMTASRVLVKCAGTGCKTIVHRILTAPM